MGLANMICHIMDGSKISGTEFAFEKPCKITRNYMNCYECATNETALQSAQVPAQVAVQVAALSGC